MQERPKKLLEGVKKAASGVTKAEEEDEDEEGEGERQRRRDMT